jgi:ABC-type antimicrobial peptide transport system permease subunit
MLDFHILAEFSRSNCIGICAFLVPANLIATLSTMIMIVLHRPTYQVWTGVGSASILALVMVLHVYTWFMIGIVMAPTYILLSLAITCLLTNFAAIFVHRRWMNNSNLSKTI